jgi:hypothetical protein
MVATVERPGTATAAPGAPRRPPRRTASAARPATQPAGGRPPALLVPWLSAQSTNVVRHAAALKPFRRAEFGAGAASPTEGHLRAVNDLIASLRSGLLRMTRGVTAAAEEAIRETSTPRLQRLVRRKERAHTWVQSIERIWDFYFELFGQRQSQFGDWLLSCDRIALDCYQDAYVNLGVARTIPAPPPFSYMRTGFSPATFRRGIPLRRLGQQLNPFPLIQLPYHRMVNPWTLGAVLHEVCHNIQNDLGLQRAIPRAIALRLLRDGQNRMVAGIWTRWNRETFADLAGLLLGGPAVVGSLLDVIGRSPTTVMAYSSRGPHPTPYLRAFLSTELLRRMGFTEYADQYERMWARLYPDPRAGTLPPALIESSAEAIPAVVDVVCFQPYPTLGNKCLADVLRFGPKEQQMIEEAGRRMAAGVDPGIVPERFLIGAARFALDNRLARPGVITENFYRELARR